LYKTQTWGCEPLLYPLGGSHSCNTKATTYDNIWQLFSLAVAIAVDQRSVI